MKQIGLLLKWKLVPEGSLQKILLDSFNLECQIREPEDMIAEDRFVSDEPLCMAFWDCTETSISKYHSFYEYHEGKFQDIMGSAHQWKLIDKLCATLAGFSWRIISNTN